MCQDAIMAAREGIFKMSIESITNQFPMVTNQIQIPPIQPIELDTETSPGINLTELIEEMGKEWWA